MFAKSASAILLALLCWSAAPALSLGELVSIQGVQENEVTGHGIVIGLEGSGDKKLPSKDRMLAAFLNNADIEVSDEQLTSKNAAQVIVTGRIPPFASAGQQMQLTVSAFGDAKSLKKGVLLYTQLYYPGEKGQSKTMYATAEGALVSPPGFPDTSALVSGIVQRSIPATVVREDAVTLLLRKPDFVDADRIARQVNQNFMREAKRNIALPLSAGVVRVEVPEQYKDNPVAFIAQLEKVPVLLTNVAAKVRINSRTGMITFNERVELSPFSFSYKDLNVVVKPVDPTVPAVKTAPNVDSRFVHYVPGTSPGGATSLKELVDTLNEMRVKPEELVEIVKEAHKLGALHAELVVE